MKKSGVITMLCINGFPTNEVWAVNIEDRDNGETTAPECEIARFKQKEKQQYRIRALKNNAKTKIRVTTNQTGNDI